MLHPGRPVAEGVEVRPETVQRDGLETYPRDLATGEVPKDCCIRAPGHPPPHDVVDPLEHIAPR